MVGTPKMDQKLTVTPLETLKKCQNFRLRRAPANLYHGRDRRGGKSAKGGVKARGILLMLWLTNAAAVPTTPPGRGDRAVSVGRSLQIDSKVTRYPGRNSGAGAW